MSEEQESGADALSPEEQSFFESGGESELPQEQETDEEAQAEDQAEAPVLDGAEQAADAPERGKTVPHQALHAEREEHKKTRSELQELKEFRARMEERWRLFEQQGQQHQEDPDPEPDPNVDVFAHNAWLSRRLQRQEERAAAEANERAKANQATEFDSKVWTYWRQDSQSYAQQNPDFQNAAKYLAEYRDKQLTAYSTLDPRFADPEMRNKQIDAELKEIVVSAANRQMSPAQLVYELAQSYGYSPEQAAAAAKEATTDGNGMSERLQKLEKGQQASRTVGQASGQGGGDEMTPEALLSLPENEFTEWMSKPGNERKFRAMMGG